MIRHTWRYTFILLIGLLAACSHEPPKSATAFLGTSLEDLRVTLNTVVTEPARRDQMVQLVNEAESELKVGIEQLMTLRKSEAALTLRYDATREELETLGNQIASIRKTYRDKLLNVRMALANLATDAEWKTITARDLAVFKS